MVLGWLPCLALGFVVVFWLVDSSWFVVGALRVDVWSLISWLLCLWVRCFIWWLFWWLLRLPLAEF